MIHVSAKHQVVAVPFRPDLGALFPAAQRVSFSGQDLIAIPHGVSETKLLQAMGLDVPAPILSQYTWGGGKPFDVQRKTAALLTTNPRAYVLNGMGTGKTKSAIWSFDYLRSKGLARRMLVTAPLSTLNFTWAREIFDTAPHLSVTVLHGDRAKRFARLKEDHDIYIINPDGLTILQDELIKRTDIDVFCIDELATFRNGSAVRSKACQKIAAGKGWVWGMTGSPTPNEPTDAWGQARIVTPNTVPKFFKGFRDATMQKLSEFRYVPKKEAADVVFNALQPAVRFSLDDVVELPEVIERTMDIDLGSKQAKVYKEIRTAAYAMVQNKEITAANAGTVLNKLLQISLGYVYSKDKGVVGLDNDLRLDALVVVVNSTPNKVLVFVPFTHALLGVAERLAKEGIDARTIDGSTPRGKREETFSLFQNTGSVKVIVAHPATMSHGLTLTAADVVVWFGPTTSLETFEQANARIRRIGQRKKQQIIMLQSTAAERKIYAKLRQKQKVQDGILDLFAEQSSK
jgi:SNF2 family DNA or RNA helicase